MTGLLPALLFSMTFVQGEADVLKPEQISSDREFTLNQVLRASLQNNPDIKKIDLDLAEKLARATEIQIPENPELQIDVFSPESGSKRYNAEVAQSLRLSHFGLRQIYAAALKHAATMERQADLIRVLNDTALLYYRYWALEKRAVMLADSEKQAAEVAKRISEALEAKETPAIEGNLFKAEALRFGAELKVTQAEKAQVQADLLRAMGLPWQEIKVSRPLLAPIPTKLFTLQEFALQRTNLRDLVIARQRAANRRYDVARVDIFPELAPRFVYERNEDGVEDWGAGLAIRIPLWDWNQAENKRAKAESELANAEARAFDRVTLDRIIEIRHRRAIALQARADAFWNDVIPTYQKSFEISRYMFEQGQASMLQLWQVQQKVIEAQTTALQDAIDALAARTLLEQAIGGKIEEIPEETNPHDHKKNN